MARDLRFSPDIPKGWHIFERNVEVAGVNHRLDQAVSFASRSQQSVILVPEPGNRHDPNAIKVIGLSKGWFLWRHHFVGYLPRETAKRIAKEGLAEVIHPALVNIWHGGYVKDYVAIRLDLYSPKPLTREKLQPKKKRTRNYRKTILDRRMSHVYYAFVIGLKSGWVV